jgi:hypothetical protein
MLFCICVFLSSELAVDLFVELVVDLLVELVVDLLWQPIKATADMQTIIRHITMFLK